MTAARGVDIRPKSLAHSAASWMGTLLSSVALALGVSGLYGVLIYTFASYGPARRAVRVDPTVLLRVGRLAASTLQDLPGA